jgi:hypothetical protein
LKQLKTFRKVNRAKTGNKEQTEKALLDRIKTLLQAKS